MNGKQQAIDGIVKFLKSDMSGLLITGTHQYKKHALIVKLLEKYYKNAHILFRTNALSNLTNNSFLGLRRQPKAGEKIKFCGNNYEFDSFNNSSTWGKTSNEFNFAIVYPIDALCCNGKLGAIDDLCCFKHIGKKFLCSWTDHPTCDYSLFRNYYDISVVYDVEEEDQEYHKRVLNMIH